MRRNNVVDIEYIKSSFDPIIHAEGIRSFIRSEIENSGCKGIVIGISGGIDSSVVAKLAIDAIGNHNVLGIAMPVSNLSEDKDMKDTIRIINHLSMCYEIIDISAILNSYMMSIESLQRCSGIKGNEKDKGNLMARIRMSILYYHANMMNMMVVGTGNRTEMLLGYFTKYGDGGVDIEPIGNLYKTQVIKLAKYLGIPDSIINKPPSAGLWKGQTDEDEIGMSYSLIDSILVNVLDEKNPISTTANYLDIDIGVVRNLLGMIEKNKHKSEAPGRRY